MTTDFALIKISYLTKFGRFVQQIYFLNLEHLSSRIIKTDGPDNFKALNYQKHSFNGALWNGCSPVNLLYIFRIPFPKNISEGLLLSSKIRYHSFHRRSFLSIFISLSENNAKTNFLL